MPENSANTLHDNIIRTTFEIDKGQCRLIIDPDRNMFRINMPDGVSAKQIVDPKIASQVLPKLVGAL